MNDALFGQTPAIPPLSATERAESLAQTLANKPVSGPIWIFAYGSLIWDPCFVAQDLDTTTLQGYRRAFNFWSVMSRGTPETPGLGMGLETGGTCQGVAYRLSDRSLDRDLDAIWKREMHNAVYEPRWLEVQAAAGPRYAIGFVTNTGHAQYAGALADDDSARIIARACGDKGPCRDYLASTIDALAGHGIDDPALSALLPLVDRYSSE